jgi:hypothetical protein
MGRGFSPAFAPVGQAISCPGCGGSGIASCCDAAGSSDLAELREPLTGNVKVLERRTGRIIETRYAEPPSDDTVVVLHLSPERRVLLRQELYHAVHTLEAQARAANPRSTRHRSLCQRAEHLRAVADQLA